MALEETGNEIKGWFREKISGDVGSICYYTQNNNRVGYTKEPSHE